MAIYGRDWRLVDQRIGCRVPLHNLTATWWPPGGRRDGVPCTVVNVSVTGALLETTWNGSVAVGDHLDVDLKGHRGPVTVRRVEHDREHGVVRFGVEFANDALREVAYTLVKYDPEQDFAPDGAASSLSSDAPAT